jgi:hypothetical protein
MFMGMTGSLVTRVMTTLGLGFVSYAGLNALASAVVNNVNASYGGLSGVTLALLTMSGFTTALNIITSSIITRASLMAVKKMMPL